MLTQDIASNMLSKLPQAVKDMPWATGLVSGLAAQLQTLDDDTLTCGRLLRSIEETPVESSCLSYINGAATPGATLASLPTIWVVEVGTSAVGQTLTQDGGATGVVYTMVYDASAQATRIELYPSTGTWVVGGAYSGATSNGVVTAYNPVAMASVVQVVSGDATNGTCLCSGIAGVFLNSSTLVFGGTTFGSCLTKLFNLQNVWLTNLGKIVGFERAQEPDETAIKYLRSQIATNASWGRLSDIYAVAASLFGEGNVYVDDGGEYQNSTSEIGLASRGPMTITVAPKTVIGSVEADYQRTVSQLISAKPAGVALWLAAHRTPTGFGTPFRFGLPNAELTTSPNVDTDILWNLLGFTNPLLTGRYYHTATLLSNGKVLVVGGIGASGNLASCELYDPSLATWASGGTLGTARYYHTATLLSNGKVLVVGGVGATGSLASCELYDPTTNSWSYTGSMSVPRTTATVSLNSNEVLAVGGISTVALATCEAYNVSTGVWSAKGSLNTARYYHTATLLASGQVLAAGGHSGSSALASTETYDPALNLWTVAGDMTSARYLHTATLLSTGKVLLIDGSAASTSCDLFDTTPRSCSATGSLPSPQTRHAVTNLADGNVLIAGGVGTGNCNKYTVATGVWSTEDSLNSPRNGATATLMTTGVVLVAGGYYGSPQSTVETYTPSIDGERCAVFNGTTSVITTPALGPSGNAPRSMGCAFYQPIPTGTQVFLGYGVAATGQAFQVKIISNTICVDVHGTAYSFGTAIAGEWHYFVATYDGTTLRGYLDGIEGTPVTVNLTTASTGPLLIGAGPSMLGFTRCISHVHLHNRALTAHEVEVLYNNGAGPDLARLNGAAEGLIHYYPMTDATSRDVANIFDTYPIVGETITQTSPSATAVVHSYRALGPGHGVVELRDRTGTWTSSSPYSWAWDSGTVGLLGHSGSHFNDGVVPNPTDTFISIQKL